MRKISEAKKLQESKKPERLFSTVVKFFFGQEIKPRAQPSKV